MCRPTTLHVRIADHFLGELEDRVDVEAELDAFDAGVGLGVRLGRQVGIDAQGDWAILPIALRDVGRWPAAPPSLSTLNRRTLFSSAVADLGVGLADAGEDDLVARAARFEGAIELAAAGDVEAGAVLGHEPARGGDCRWS